MKKNHRIFLGITLFFGLGLRLFKLRQLFYFSMDEALLAFRGWGLFVLKRPFLIGGISPLQVHLPPYFYYLSAFFLRPFNFDPVGWGVWSALIGLITIYCLFYIGKRLVNPKVGLLASLLYAVSFTAVFFDRHYWPLNLNPLFCLLTLIIIDKLSSKPTWLYFALAILTVMAVTADPSNIPLVVTCLIFYFFNDKKINSKFTSLSIIFALGLFFAPLVLFDLRHNWQNFFGVSRLIQRTSQHQLGFPKLIDSLFLIPRSLVRFWYSPQTNISQLHAYCSLYAQQRQENLPLILVILALVVLIWFVKKNLKSSHRIKQMMAMIIILYSVGMLVFGGLGYSIFDHYLAVLLPVFALLTVMVINKLGKPGLVLAGFLIVTNLIQISKASNPAGLAYKQQLISWANEKLENQDFGLDVISKCHRENGLRYLFELTDNPPTISFMDPHFFWLYRQSPNQVIPDKILLVSDKPFESTLPVISQQKFGGLDAYILDNSSQEYQFKF